MGMHMQKGRSRALRSLMDAALEKGAPWAELPAIDMIKRTKRHNLLFNEYWDGDL